ncbi:unnamed protein product [Porites lobata]|uniref:Sas10 C-terminal domain-containing protein n=1 Tax=Porites lobata TaxID=104759 RepID=A0ABN8QD08_9CNID|nr:unnamed protein product [Porites lobata]
MARSKRKSKPTRPKVNQREEVYDEPDPNKEDFFYDDVDKFHAEREKILLDSTAYDEDGNDQSSDDNGQVEDVMALNIDESDDDDSEVNAEDDVDEDDFEEENEDLDEEDEGSENEKDSEKDIPSQKSWGRKKASFYDADMVEEYAGSDEEMDKLAEEEEEEALALQKHMAACLEEQDFDTAEFELPKPDHKKEAQDQINKEKIVQDLSKLSKAEKIQILVKDSPELFQLIDEFKSKLKEVIERVHPLVKMARAGQIPKEGANYLELKHQLYLNYCINIGFYLLLKAKKLSARDHPVMERLVQYQKLIKELEPLDEKLKPEIEELLSQSRVFNKNAVQEKSKTGSVQSKITTKNASKNPVKLSALLDEDEDEDSSTRAKTEEKEETLSQRKKEKRRKRKTEVETEVMDPLEYYEAVKLQKKRKKEAKEAAFRFSEQQEIEEGDVEEGKRGITYEISQNKGLTAKKKKELRNPRVKHRKKFYKAKIKRKSQVREVVNEQNRYGGEATGIRSHLTRSTKIK